MPSWEQVRSWVDTGEPFQSVPEGAVIYPVVGVTFVEGYPNNILETVAGTPIRLIRNPDNKYDSNAIEVYANGKMLGHLSKEVAAQFAPKLDAGEMFLASVWQIRVSPENPHNPGIDIIVRKYELGMR